MSIWQRAFAEIAAVVLGHAVIGALVHALGGASAYDVHRVHLPLAVAALLLIVVCGCRQTSARARLGSPALLLGRTVGVVGYLVTETVMVDGFGSHLLHDPWLALAPLGVLLASSATAAITTAGLAIIEWWPRAGLEHAAAVLVRRDVEFLPVWHVGACVPSVRGRGPPTTA